MTSPSFNFLVRQEQSRRLQGTKMLEPSERAVFTYLPLIKSFVNDLFSVWGLDSMQADQVP